MYYRWFHFALCSFKPCYKWNTFNTQVKANLMEKNGVLNLVINGIPSIPLRPKLKANDFSVLNLVINGIPSILSMKYLACQ